MRKNEEEQGAKVVRYMVNALWGGVLALAVCIVCLLAAAAGISKGWLGMDFLYQTALVGCVAGAFVGGRLAVRRSGSRALVMGLAAGLVLFLLLLTVGVAGFQSAPDERAIGLLCASLCGGAAAGLLGKRGKKKKRRK